MTEVTILRDRFVRGWPRHEHGERAYTLELSRALERRYATDAHFAAYRTPNDRRLTREALDRGLAVELVATVFDVDCQATHGTPDPTPDPWRRELRQKVAALSQVHPYPYFYETRGGGRIVYVQRAPTVIYTLEDAKAWSQSYAVAIAYLARAFDIVADPACGDWQRLFRAPHATRDLGGSPENWPILGNSRRIGDIVINATEADVEAAKRASTVFGSKRAREPLPLGIGGNGLFFHALRVRGHIGAMTARGGWICICPNHSQHSRNTDWSTSTIVVPPDAGHELGLILCRHGHCWERFTVQQWLHMFSDTERDAARAAPGIRRGRAA